MLDFIGSNLVVQLSQKHKVYVLDDLSNGCLDNLVVACKFTRGDIVSCDLSPIIDKVDAVFHLACRKMIYSINFPQKDLEVNTIGTLRILEAARKRMIPVIYTSTGSVYGNPSKFPTPEEHPACPESPYGISKFAAEEYCRLYYKLYKLRTIIVRIHSVYGPVQSMMGVVSKFINQSLLDQKLTIEGVGNQKRCFTHVDDCVSGILTAYEKGQSGETYNIAGTRPYSITEIAHLVAEVTNKPYQFKRINRKKGDLQRTHPDTKKIRALGWKPKINMRKGIINTMEWMKYYSPSVYSSLQ